MEAYLKKNTFLCLFTTVSLLTNCEGLTNFRPLFSDAKIIKSEILTAHVNLQEKEPKGQLHIEEPYSIIFRYNTMKACFSSYNCDVEFCFKLIKKLIATNIKYYNFLFTVRSKKNRNNIKSLATIVLFLLMHHKRNYIIKAYEQYKFL